MSEFRKKLAVVCGNISRPFLNVENIFLLPPAVEFQTVSLENADGIVGGFYNIYSALADGVADIAVFPAESLPYPLPEGLELYAVAKIPSEAENSESENELQTTPRANGYRLAAVLGKENRNDLKELFATSDIRQSYGKVTLVGFGPGNPELLTIMGDKALAAADIIFYDNLIDKDSLGKYRGEKVYVGKRRGNHSHEQAIINELLYKAAAAGKNVVRLKGGDPMIFAHGREEIDFLRSRFINVTVVPGVSSGIAAAAAAQIPLTHRGISSSVAFVSGHNIERAQTPDADTLIYYMAGANISGVAEKLIASGRRADTPVALVSNASLPNQRIFFSSLKELQSGGGEYPTPVIMLAGDVVSLESKTFKGELLRK